MGALDRVDAVELDEAKTLDQREQRIALRGARWAFRQCVAVQEEPPRRAVGKDRKGAGHGARDSRDAKRVNPGRDNAAEGPAVVQPLALPTRSE